MTLLDWDTLPLIVSFNDTVVAPRILRLAERLGLEEAYQKAVEEDRQAGTD